MFFSGSSSSQALVGLLACARAARRATGSSSVDEPEDDRHDGEADRPDLRDRLPAVGDEHEGARNLVTAAPTLPAPKMPSAVPVAPLDTSARHRRRRPRRSRRRCRRRARPEAFGDRCRRRTAGRSRPAQQHRSGEDEPAAVLVGPDAERDPDQRAGQDRRADKQAELGLVEPEVLLMWMPMMAKIVQTAKQTVNAAVVTPKTWPELGCLVACMVGCPCDGGCVVGPDLQAKDQGALITVNDPRDNCHNGFAGNHGWRLGE